MADAALVNQRCCLEKSGQWLENVDQTHLVLASGKLVVQKVSGSKSNRESRISD